MMDTQSASEPSEPNHQPSGAKATPSIPNRRQRFCGAFLAAVATACGTGLSDHKANVSTPLSAVSPVSDTVRHRCVGGTEPGRTAWRDYLPHRPGLGLVATVDTSACRYRGTPLYFASIGGKTHHWTARGSASIYNATPESFEIYLDTQITADEANNTANTDGKMALAWNLQWEAYPEGKVSPSQCAGQTTPGETPWVADSAGVLTLHVDTQACGFTQGSAPSYFTSLGGASRHWRAVGHQAILEATATGFSVSVHNSGLTAAQAQDLWHLNWNARVANTSETPSAICHGQATAWKQYRHTNTFFMDVKTSDCNFQKTPRYFTSLGGTAHSQVEGSNAVYFPSASGFRVYVRTQGLSPKDFRLHWKAVVEPEKKAMWIWEQDTTRMLNDAPYAKNALEFLADRGFGTLYLYAGDQIENGIRRGLDTEAGKYRRLLRQLHAGGMEVHALLGSERLQSDRWALDNNELQGATHQRAVDAAQEIVAYNQGQVRDEQFDGVHLSILPHRTTAWNDPAGGPNSQQAILEQYLAMSAKVLRALTPESTGPTGVSIPWWYNQTVEFGGSNRPIYEHIMGLYDYVTLLTARDSWQAIYSLAKQPIRYAQQLGKPIVLGVETRRARELASGPDGEPASASHITFCEEGPDTMQIHLDRAGAHAFAIHDFRWYQALVDEFVDPKHRELFGENLEERCALNLLDVHGGKELKEIPGAWLVPAHVLYLGLYGFSKTGTETTSFEPQTPVPGPNPSYSAGFRRPLSAEHTTVFELRTLPFHRVGYLAVETFGPAPKVAIIAPLNGLRDQVLVFTKEAATAAKEVGLSTSTTSFGVGGAKVQLTEWTKEGSVVVIE